MLQSMGSQRIGHNWATEPQICFTYGNVYVSMLLSQFVSPSPSPTGFTSLFCFKDHILEEEPTRLSSGMDEGKEEIIHSIATSCAVVLADDEFPTVYRLNLRFPHPSASHQKEQPRWWSNIGHE